MVQVIEKTLAEYIDRATKGIELTKRKQNPQDAQWDQYEVYPEDDGYDLPRNPYSSV